MTTDSHNPRAAKIRIGKDEMNLAEFPFAMLRNTSDHRNEIVYEGWQTHRDGSRYQQRWVVQGGSSVGLPTELDERVYVALLGISYNQGLTSKKIGFSIYQILKILDLPTSQQQYAVIEKSLDRLTAVTFKSQNAFFDNRDGAKKRVTTVKAFHLIESYWLRYMEADDHVRDGEGVPAYVVWSEELWNSLKSGYIKNLDLHFFRSLTTPISRRLYRFLDKRMQYQTEYEIDIFELSARLAMVRYKYPSRVYGKLKPALDELIAQGFLVSAELCKVGKYTRVQFVRTDAPLKASKKQSLTENQPQGENPELVTRLMELTLSEDRARDMVERFSAEHIQAKIELLEWKLDPHTRQKGRPIEDPAAWLIRAIEQDYKPPATFKPRAEREKAKEERERIIQQVEEGQAAERAEQEARRVERKATLFAQYGTTDEDTKIWEQAQAGIRNRIPTTQTYQLWVRPAQLLSYADGEARLGVPSTHHRDWLLQRAGDILAEALEDVVGRPVSIEYICLNQTPVEDKQD